MLDGKGSGLSPVAVACPAAWEPLLLDEEGSGLSPVAVARPAAWEPLLLDKGRLTSCSPTWLRAAMRYWQ